MSDVVRKVGAGDILPAFRLSELKNNLHHAPKHRWERVTRLIVAFEKGQEFDHQELKYALKTADIVEKRMDGKFAI